jgi:hypothetical protein
LYTEASSDTLPLGASPLVINCDFILGSNLQRPGKENQYYIVGNFAEKLTAFAQSIPGASDPNEAVWITPNNATLNTIGTYASALLNVPSTFSFVQAVYYGGSASASTTITNGAGNLMFMCVDTSDAGANPPTVSDTNGNNWVKIRSDANGGNTSVSIWYAENIKGGPNTITVVNHNTSIYCLVRLAEYAGPYTTGSLDQQNGTQQPGGGNTINTTIDNELVVFASTTVTPSFPPTFSAGWNARLIDPDLSTIGDKIVPVSGTPVPLAGVLATFPNGPQWFYVASFRINLLKTPGISQILKATNFAFNLSPTETPVGLQVEISGKQSGISADEILTVNLVDASGATGTKFIAQLPLVNGQITIGTHLENWGFALTPAMLNNPNFGVEIVASASTLVTFSIYAVKLKLWVTDNPAPNFNYLKTFTETGGEVLTLALGSDGVIYQEDVNNLPGALAPVYSAIQPDSFAQSATVDDREFIAVSNLQNGTDIPYTYTPPNFDRLSQVGPGAPPSASTTASSETVVSITQFPAVTHDLETSGFRAVLWSAGPSTMSPGSTITIFYSRVGFGLAVADPHIVIGQGIKITGLPFLNGHANEPINGTYTVVSVGSGIPPNGNFSNQHWYFTVTAPSTQSGIQFTAGSGIAGTAYQVTLATMTTSAQIPNLEVGNQFQLAGTGGAPPAGYDGPWTVIDTPNAAQMQITSTVLLNNVATYGFNLITGANPVVGEFVTVTSTLNGNGVFNVANAVITSTSPGSFSISVTHANVTSAAETGAGIIFGTIFTFDPMQIIGNIFGGTIVTIGVIAAGVRKVCYSFLTRNGFLTQPSPILTFDVIAGASGIVIGDLLPGPSNVIARVVHLTAANGGNFYNIPVPVTVNDNGTNVINSSTWINDNFTTNVVLSFSDGVLLAADQIDIEGNNLFECGELGSCVALVPYAQRLFAIGEQNKITNLLNYSFDGGIIAATQYPAGWVVDPTSGAGGSVTASPIFGNAYLIKNLSGITQTTYGMITQAVFQDEFLVPIIVPSTTYSVRVTASCPTGAASGNLVADLYSPKLGIALGTFTVLLNSMQTSMQIFTGTLLTTVLAPVPDDLEIRLYTTNLPNGVQVLIDRIEPFPTELPNLNGQIIGSYQNNFEAFDRLSGVILATQQNQQPVVSAFAQFGTLYMVKTGSMVAVNDNNTTEPANWTTPRVISQSVGSVGVYAVTAGIDVANAGEEWALIGGIPGLFLFQGSQPVKLSEEIQSVWNQINWAYGYTMWVVNDIKNRRILVGAPLKALNSLGQRPFWLPAGLLTDNNPTTPNMVIELNYKQLNTASALMDSVQIHRSYSGKLIASDIVRKWSLWTIKSPCAALIQRPDTTSATFLGNSDHNGKIFALVDGLLEDDGAAVRQLYATAGFVPSETGQGMQIGMTRFIYNYMTLIIGGAGELIITVYPNSLDSPYAHALLPNLTLPLETNGDIEVPVDEAGSRLFVIFETNAVGAGFELSRLVMAMCQDAFSPIRGRND